MTTQLKIETFPNKAAADYIRGKAVADPQNFGALPDQLKQRAFTVAGIEQLDAVKRIRDAVAKLPEGASWDEAKKEIAAQISPFVGDGGMDAAARDKAARARAEHTLRTQGFQAYAVARHQQQMATVKSHPYWMYETVGDNRVRAGHAKLDGKVLRADDPWWKTHYPPWDWGCRCVVIALDEEDAQEFGISKSGDMPWPERSDSYSFDPSDAGISLDMLIKRYENDEYGLKMFSAKCRQATVQEDGREPATMWDYMVDRKMEKQAGSLVAQTERDGKERAIVIDFTTGKQIGKVAVGDEGNVGMNAPRVAAPDGLPSAGGYDARNRDVATLHTHPAGDNTPSPADILFGFETKSKAEYIAAGKKLRRWQWLKTPEPADIDLLKMYHADNNAGGVNLKAYDALITRLIREGYIKMEELS